MNAQTSRALRLGRRILIRYHGKTTRHERMLLAIVSDQEWLVVEPGGRKRLEHMDAADEVRLIPVSGGRPTGVIGPILRVLIQPLRESKGRRGSRKVHHLLGSSWSDRLMCLSQWLRHCHQSAFAWRWKLDVRLVALRLWCLRRTRSTSWTTGGTVTRVRDRGWLRRWRGPCHSIRVGAKENFSVSDKRQWPLDVAAGTPHGCLCPSILAAKVMTMAWQATSNGHNVDLSVGGLVGSTCPSAARGTRSNFLGMGDQRWKWHSRPSCHRPAPSRGAQTLQDGGNTM